MPNVVLPFLANLFEQQDETFQYAIESGNGNLSFRKGVPAQICIAFKLHDNIIMIYKMFAFRIGFIYVYIAQVIIETQALKTSFDFQLLST